ncbi:MAG: VOC family protein, partial [Lapillicoccus sp.]
MGVTWLTAFLDTPAENAEASEQFWAAVTGWPLSDRRGSDGEFATLQPHDGDAVLKAQVVGEPPPGLLHLDVHVDDVAGESARALGLGAEPLSDASGGYVVHRSPGGITFCLVPHEARRRPGPVSWPAGHSLVDQVCLDLPGDAYEREAQFWADLLGWPRTVGAVPPFERLLPPDGQGMHVLV